MGTRKTSAPHCEVVTGRPENDATLPVSNPAVQHWNPRAYRFLLERQTAAMRVLVVGHSPGLVRSLAADGVQVVSVLDTGEAPEESLPGDITVLRDGRLPVDDSGFHQVLVPELSRSLRALFPHELARALRPGGGMFVGAHNRLYSRRAEALTCQGGRRLLIQAGLTDVEVYGIRNQLPHPMYILPMSAGHLHAWYLHHAFFPKTRRGAVAARLLAATARLGTGQLIFRAIGFTARAGERTC